MIEFSTSCTSPLIRATMSPLRSLEKKLSGSESILSNSVTRISLTMPVRIGTRQAEDR